MIEIVLSPGQRELRQRLLPRVCQSERSVLLVPEQASHEMERALCKAGGDGICLRTEVLSFSRLASRVFAQCGGVSRRTLDKGGRLLAIAQAVEAVGAQLKLYGAGRRPEFLLRLLRILEEFRAARIGPGALHDAAEKTDEGRLKVKLEELALILESYETVLATMGQDPSGRLELLAQKLEGSNFAEGLDIFLLGFTDFTGQELAVLDALLDHAGGLTVGLLGDGEADGAFPLTAATVRTLERLAQDHGLPTKLHLLPDEAALAPELRHLRRHLLSGAPAPFEGEAPALVLHHSANIQSACLDAAGQILSLVLEQGWRFRDLAVCCTAPELYGPALESVFGRSGIPLYRAGVEPIRSDPVAGMLLSALDAATGGMETEDVLRFLKSGLSPLSQAESDALENYARLWRIRGGRWDAAWDMPPGGFGGPLDERALLELEGLNNLRVRGVGPLLALERGLKRARDVAGQVRALYSLLTGIGLAERLEEMVRRCETEAKLQRAQAYGQMYETVTDALEQLYRVLGQTVRTPEDFAGLVGAVLSQCDVGTIPADLDSVVLGGVEALRFTERRALLLLGAEDGTLPSCQSETGLLSERERRQLQELGLPVAPGRSDSLDRELLAIAQVTGAPSERLYVNYCTEQPSYLFTRLARLFPGVPIGTDEAVPVALTYVPEALCDFLSGRDGIALPPPLSERTGALRKRAAHRLGRLSRTGVRDLYGETFQLSASKIDQYAACRCAYFLRYGLKLRAQKEAEFDAVAYGTFVHRVLERTCQRVRDEGGFHAASPARLEQIATEEMDAYEEEALAPLLAQSERSQHLFRRDREELLSVVQTLGEELRTSGFEPAAFELEFSVQGALPPVEIQGDEGKATLQGFVDRVDLFTSGGETYVRVVDYKTGKKSFDYTDLLCGMGLQMLIYLFTLEQSGKTAFGRALRPAGVLYVPARRPLLSAQSRPDAARAEELRAEEETRQGLVLSEDGIPEAMGDPRFLPFRQDKDGKLTGDLADGAGFAMLRAHVRRTLEAMADAIAGGAVDPDPIVRGTEWSACTWCDYAQVCHRAGGGAQVRPMRKTKRDEFWARLRQEEEQDG